MFKNSIVSIFEEVWPMLLICSIIAVQLRAVYLYKNKKPLILYKELLYLISIIYIMCLFYVVTFQDVSWSTSNFTLFKEMFRYEFGTKLFFHNVIGNMLMFIPFGFLISYFLKLEKPYSIIILSFITSVTIEVTQLLIGRVFDIDDIILNVIGGLIGFLLFYILGKIEKHLPNWLKKGWIYSIIMVILIVMAIIYLVG
ncbi:MAG: VanZ family protein [Candidatus Faecisoma sp.]|nr:VanZ family protein [Acholeplasma sp.]MDY2892358.1 VanZ family protein [Candidatus Faecisoma sp.]CCY27512.1 vanZ family protein [Acholeplasma sp. CAG:878]